MAQQTTAVVKSPVKDLSVYLARSQERIAAALPRHLTAERLIKVAVTAASRNPRLLECTPESFLMAVVEAGQLGLEPNGTMGQAYLVPYKNNKTGHYEAQFQPGYRGLVTLATRSGDTTSIEARAVFEGDRFEFEYGLAPRCVHRPLHDEQDPEKLTHVYAIARMRNGEPKFDVMPKADVEKIRKRSRAKDDGPWVTDYVEMAKKTIVRRLCKSLPMSPELQAAIEKDNAVDSGQAVPLSQLDPSYGDPVDPEPRDPDAKAGAVEERLNGKGRGSRKATEKQQPETQPDPAPAADSGIASIAALDELAQERNVGPEKYDAAIAAIAKGPGTPEEKREAVKLWIDEQSKGAPQKPALSMT